MTDYIKTYILLAVCLVGFISTWIIVNDSYVINRDEMYYASYSTAFSEHETEDIRFISEKDHYTVAMLPLYRILLRSSISIFGKNILNVLPDFF